VGITIMKKLILFGSLLLIGVGCATNAKYSKILDSWSGGRVDKLYTSWGQPDRSTNAPDGRQIIVYTQEANVQSGGYNDVYTVVSSGATTHSGMKSTEVQKKAPVRDVNFWCETTFIATPSGIITSATSNGNNCRGRPAR
jgi:hypothetical protein